MVKPVNQDHTDFPDLIEPYRLELQIHCYHLVGTIQDSEDLVQETFLKALAKEETLKERASLRAWLYKIATNTCLDFLRSQKRRFVPLTHQPGSSSQDPIPASIYEPIWLEPYPDPDNAIDTASNPEQEIERRESIRMAFIALLHRLPPRQRAVLILQDVIGWQAKEIADALNTTVPAVKSALHRARVTLENTPAPMPSQQADEDLRPQLEAYVRAWENGDVDGLVALLTDDATFSMPPIPSWYAGRENIRALIAKTIFAGDAKGRWRMLPARANGQIAFALYRQNPAGNYDSYGIQLLEVEGSYIRDIITFREAKLFRHFHLPETITS
jgi:RNA polymerase sigma-70 factor (ECF subfamily)